MKRSGTVFLYAYTGLVAYTLLAGGIVATLELVKQKAPAPVAETRPVVLKPLKLSKSQRAVDQLAALTPGCQPHDWACVVGRGGLK